MANIKGLAEVGQYGEIEKAGIQKDESFWKDGLCRQRTIAAESQNAADEGHSIVFFGEAYYSIGAMLKNLPGYSYDVSFWRGKGIGDRDGTVQEEWHSAKGTV